jgi:triacylglycerol lipase
MRYHLLLLLFFSFSLSCKEQEKKKDAGQAFTNAAACTFSEIAYCSDPQHQLDQYLPGWKIVWNPPPVSGNYVFAATDGATYVLAFRGSLISFTVDAFTNWIYHDLNVVMQDKWPYTNTEKARISQGSYIGWQNLEKMKDKTTGKTLWTFLSENITDKTPLVLTGHSLGGNLATVYASYLWWKFNEDKRPKTNINVITFAAPAAGNNSFADDFNKKFPASARIENTQDIVPKFPCSNKVAGLGKLYTSGPSAAAISIGYNNMTTALSNVFTLLSTAMDLFEYRGDYSGYVHTNGDGSLVTIALSGKNTSNNAVDWFAEAGYQHGIAQYAVAVGAPVIKCE